MAKSCSRSSDKGWFKQVMKAICLRGEEDLPGTTPTDKRCAGLLPDERQQRGPAGPPRADPTEIQHGEQHHLAAVPCTQANTDDDQLMVTAADKAPSASSSISMKANLETPIDLAPWSQDSQQALQTPDPQGPCLVDLARETQRPCSALSTHSECSASAALYDGLDNCTASFSQIEFTESPAPGGTPACVSAKLPSIKQAYNSSNSASPAPKYVELATTSCQPCIEAAELANLSPQRVPSGLSRSSSKPRPPSRPGCPNTVLQSTRFCTAQASSLARSSRSSSSPRPSALPLTGLKEVLRAQLAAPAGAGGGGAPRRFDSSSFDSIAAVVKVYTGSSSRPLGDAQDYVSRRKSSEHDVQRRAKHPAASHRAVHRLCLDSCPSLSPEWWANMREQSTALQV